LVTVSRDTPLASLIIVTVTPGITPARPDDAAQAALRRLRVEMGNAERENRREQKTARRRERPHLHPPMDCLRSGWLRERL
jgi:hypothetical protein